MNLMTQCHISPDSKNNISCVYFLTHVLFENGWGEGDWDWGIIYNFQEKQGLKYCDLPLH